jgi:hypothetical protein
MSASTPNNGGAELIPNATTQTPPTPTAAQEQAVASHLGLHHYSDGSSWLVNLFPGMAGDPNSTDTLDPSTVLSLRNGLDTRSAPQPPGTNYAAMSHQQLYDAVTQNVDAGQIGNTAAGWDQSSQDLIEASQNNASQALAISEQAWTGPNAEKARASVAALANVVGQAGQASQVSAQLYKQQAAALQTAKNSIPVPPAQPFSAATARQQLMTVTDPLQAANLAAQDHAQFAAQQAAHQQAIEVVSNYDKVVAQTSQNQPAFAPAPQVAKPGGGPSAGTPNLPGGAGGAGGGNGAPHLGNAMGGGWSAPTSHGGASGGNSAPPSLGAPAAAGPPIGTTGGGSGGTGLSGFPGAPTPGGQSGVGPGGSSGVPGGGSTGFGQSPTGQGLASGSGDPGLIPPMGGMPVGGSGGTGGAGGLGSGGGYRAGGGFGPGGSGSSGGSGGAGGSGARSGVGATGAAAEESAMGGEAAATRGGGAVGGGMGGGRGGKGVEDGEHKRASFLLEPDPNAFFGTDEKTAPPVIGE